MRLARIAPIVARLTTALTILAITAITMSACGGESDEQTIPAPQDPETLILATTTSLNDSGLLDELAPIFEAEQGVDVKIIAVGTGAALLMGERGEADVLLVHAPSSERALLENGDVSDRVLIAYNDFAIIGPASDPAGVRGMTDAAAALARISEYNDAAGGGANAPFASRGDDSGTHKKERALWDASGVEPSGEWYLQTGQGMGATLNVADQRAAYTLTDRGTFLALGGRLQLVVLVEGDARLLNYYSVLPVSAAKGGINVEAAAAWAAFLARDDIQQRIGEYRRTEYGRSLFIPAAGDSEEAIAARGGAPRE